MLLLIVLLLPLMSLLLVVAAVLSTLVTVDLLHIGKDEAPNPLAWLLCILQLPLWYYTIKTIIIFSSIYLSAMGFLWKGTPSTAYNIHSIVKNEKSVQKKFAFAENGGIVSDKGLETLGNSGCNADIVGVTPGQSLHKSILGLSSGIYASTTITVFPARQALFVCAWKRRQKENKNCLGNRRAESCNKTCKALPHPAVSGKFPEKSHSTFAIRSSRAIVLARSLKTLSSAEAVTVKAATPTNILDLERAVPARNSARLMTCFQPLQVLFRFCVKTDAKIQSTICNPIIRRITPCQTHKTCKANSQQKNSARISSAPSELSITPAKKIHSCRHAAQTRWNLRFSRCGSTMQSKKSKRSGWKNGQKQLEWQQQSADSIAENHRIHKFLAFADRSDRGFYRPCQITQARSVFV